jgi:hypothetical protein
MSHIDEADARRQIRALSVEQLHEELAYCRTQVATFAAVEGLVVEEITLRAGGFRDAATARQTAEWRELAGQGWSVRRIAASAGASKSTVARRLAG